jgi:hypothetical protein
MIARLHYPYGQPPEGQDAVWRCEARRYAYVVDYERDEWGITDPRLELRWELVDRRTPKGVWVAGSFNLLSAKRSKYKATPQEAVQHFVKRRERQVKILKGQLAYAERELDMAKGVSFG